MPNPENSNAHLGTSSKIARLGEQETPHCYSNSESTFVSVQPASEAALMQAVRIYGASKRGAILELTAVSPAVICRLPPFSSPRVAVVMPA